MRASQQEVADPPRPARSRSRVRPSATAAPLPTSVEAPTARSDRSHRRLAATVMAAVAAVAVLIALLLAGIRVMHDGAVGDARSAALSAARTFVVDATNYDYQQIDEEFQGVLDRSTGEFRQTFLASSAQAKGKITQFQARSRGQVDDAAVRDVTTDSATVLVVADQQVVNTSPDGPRTERDRLRLTLVRSDGRWLVSKLESL
jgi:Mce-associated membrane protein